MKTSQFELRAKADADENFKKQKKEPSWCLLLNQSLESNLCGGKPTSS